MRYRWIAYLLAAVWLINGLLCKVLHLVPRHEQIVARILGPVLGVGAAPMLTRLIGLGEIGIGLWILSGRFRRWSSLAQIGLVLMMNALEFALAPDLLLWGRWNAVFALLFAGLVYRYEFHLAPAPTDACLTS